MKRNNEQAETRNPHQPPCYRAGLDVRTWVEDLSTLPLVRARALGRSADLKNQMTYQTYIKQVGLEEISCEEARAVGLLVIGLTYQCSKFWVSQDRQQGLALDPIHKKFYLWYAAFQPHRSDWLDADAEYQ